MELHQLRYFCAVATAGNFTRAAESQHVSQPSLSQQILNLEEELGAKLFDRLGREVRLTEVGRNFLPKAQAILKQVADAKHEVEEIAGAMKGEVAIGVIPTIAPYFFPSRLAAFAREYPQVRVNVVEDVTPALLEALRRSALDLAVVALPLPGREYSRHEICREPLYAVLPSSHPLSRSASLSMTQLEREPFLLLREGHCFRDTVIAACKRAGAHMKLRFESGQFATILAMVAAKMGVSVVPAMAVQEFAGCRFIPLADPRAQRRVGVVHLKNHYLSKAQVALLKELRREVPEAQAAKA